MDIPQRASQVGNKPTEMPVRLNAVHVTIAVCLGENVEKLLFLEYYI